jgi:hypothetical protein
MKFFTATEPAGTIKTDDDGHYGKTGETFVSLTSGKVYGVVDSVLTVVRTTKDGPIVAAYFSACSLVDTPTPDNTMKVPVGHLGSEGEILDYVESVIPTEVKAAIIAALIGEAGVSVGFVCDCDSCN